MLATHPEGTFGLHLVAYGYGRYLPAVVSPSPIGAGPRVEYRRGPLTEWYLNDARGLEQGFTLREPPPNPDGGPLALELAVSGSLIPKLSSDGIQLRHGGREVLRYDGLRAWDARGHALAAHMELRGGTIRLLVSDAGAVYPVTVDPWVQQQRLTASDGAAGDAFGISAAVDGDTAVIGAFNKTVGGKAVRGAAYVFVRSGTTWTQQQELTASDGAANDSFGISVAVSGDTAVVGAYVRALGTSLAVGAAYVFVRNGTLWSQQQILTASDASTNDYFGNSVAVSGNTAVIGAYRKSVNGNAQQGAAYVFTRSGALWTQQQEITSIDGAALDTFGWSVDVDGDTAIFGAVSKTVGANIGQGSAYVYTRSGTVWSLQHELTADASESDARRLGLVGVDQQGHGRDWGGADRSRRETPTKALPMYTPAAGPLGPASRN